MVTGTRGNANKRWRDGKTAEAAAVLLYQVERLSEVQGLQVSALNTFQHAENRKPTLIYPMNTLSRVNFNLDCPALFAGTARQPRRASRIKEKILRGWPVCRQESDSVPTSSEASRMRNCSLCLSASALRSHSLHSWCQKKKKKQKKQQGHYLTILDHISVGIGSSCLKP